MKATGIALLLLLAAGSATVQGETSVTFVPAVSVAKDRLAASDLIAGEVSPSLRRVLDRVDLGYTPMPGYTREFDRASLLRILSQHGVPESREWNLPETVTVRRRCRLLTPEEIEQAAAEFVRTLGSSTVRVVASKVICPAKIFVPEGTIRLNFTVPRRTLMGKRLDLLLAVSAASGTLRKQWVQAEIEYTATVPVATRDIRPSEVIAAADFRIEERHLESVVSKLLEPSFTPEGQAARRAIHAGDVISPYYIAPPVLVRLGDRITLLVKTESFELQTEGVARGAGRLGDKIAVLNADTRKIIYGRVVGEKKVEVES